MTELCHWQAVVTAPHAGQHKTFHNRHFIMPGRSSSDLFYVYHLAQTLNERSKNDSNSEEVVHA